MTVIETPASLDEPQPKIEEVVMLFPWWLVLVQGIVALAIGVVMLTNTVITTVFLVQVLGWYWLIASIVQIASIFLNKSQWGWRLASGILGLLAGMYIIGAPLMGAVVVVGVATILLGVNGMLIGAIDLVKAFNGGGWGVGVLGALSLIIGGAIAFNAPQFMLALPWVWGAFALIGGILSVIGALQLRKLQNAVE
jgi:uncharacterized membrane protein HdeD (DUF308 family)